MASHDAAKTLAGKVALVTGAGRGLGRAFAEKLAGLGAAVAIHGMRENGPAEYGEGTTLTAVAQEVGRDHGVRTVRVLGDLTKSDQIERVVTEAHRDAFGLEAQELGRRQLGDHDTDRVRARVDRAEPQLGHKCQASITSRRAIYYFFAGGLSRGSLFAASAARRAASCLIIS